jgi:hypothetical protein
MITCTSLGGSAVKCALASKSVAVFPGKTGASADLKLLSTPDEKPKEGEISWPGEYDSDGVAIRGIGHDEGARVSYAVETEGKRIAFLSSPLHQWSDHELELLGDVDVLFLPADDAKVAQELIDKVDPRVLIPLPTKDEAVFTELLKICGAQDKELSDEYKVKGGLPSEGREVVILKPSK